MENQGQPQRKGNAVSRFFNRHFSASTKVARLPAMAAGTAAGVSSKSAGSSGSDNSAAMSRDMKKSSENLERYLKEMDKVELDTFTPVGLSLMGSFIEKQEAYTNSSFPFEILQEQTLPPQEIQLLHLAAYCAHAVKKRRNETAVPATGFEPVRETLTIGHGLPWSSSKPTTVGLYKSTATVPASSTQTGSASRFSMSHNTYLVVAVRGTASIHDWLVNFNQGEYSDASLDDKDGILGKNRNGDNYCAHPGFLSCTKEMLPEVCKAITKATEEFRGDSVPRTPWDLHLVLTGHSAGGAVAAMLYAHFIKPRAAETVGPSIPHEEFAGIHCVTFGAPPITTTPIPPFNPDSVFLSIVNEGDPIPRADGPYFDDLLKLLVTARPSAGARWQLSPRKYFNAGTVLIVPRDNRGGYFLPNETGNGSLAETIMGNLEMHKMRVYLEGQGGRINGPDDARVGVSTFGLPCSSRHCPPRFR